MEDLTDPEKIRTEPKCDRTVSLYGYLRGTHLKNKGQVHVPGEGAVRRSCSWDPERWAVIGCFCPQGWETLR